jgi:hypothetical protein
VSKSSIAAGWFKLLKMLFSMLIFKYNPICGASLGYHLSNDYSVMSADFIHFILQTVCDTPQDLDQCLYNFTALTYNTTAEE